MKKTKLEVCEFCCSTSTTRRTAEGEPICTPCFLKKESGKVECAGCGCTDDHACEPHVCYWEKTKPPICSECADRARKLLKTLNLNAALAALKKAMR